MIIVVWISFKSKYQLLHDKVAVDLEIMFERFGACGAAFAVERGAQGSGSSVEDDSPWN